MTPQEKAVMLIEYIEKALTRGVKHYNKAGKELKTPLDIINCLLEEESVQCEDPSVMQGVFNLLDN